MEIFITLSTIARGILKDNKKSLLIQKVQKNLSKIFGMLIYTNTMT